VPRPPIGAHVPVGRGLATQGLAYAADTGAEAVQVFLGNPRGWAAHEGDPDEDRRFRQAVEAGLPAFVHASYLVNLGSPDTLIVERSVAALSHAVHRGRTIGAHGVVVHTGSAVEPGRQDDALAQVRETLLPVLDALPDDGPDVLLEPTAGQGRSLCSTVDELAEYLAALGHHPRLGLCLDTCHLFAAGHDLAARGGMKRLLDRLPDAAGPVPLRLVHANDSMDEVGAHRDRHAAIGEGHIGEAPFAAMLRHRLLAGVPVVIETPGDRDAHAKDVATLKLLRRR
jgi:deoxyribonuclease IV